MKKGFTLIELLGVFAFLAIIMIIAYPIMMKNNQISLSEEFKAGIRILNSAINMKIDDYKKIDGQIGELEINNGDYQGHWFKVDKDIIICGLRTDKHININCLNVNEIDYSDKEKMIDLDNDDTFVTKNITIDIAKFSEEFNVIMEIDSADESSLKINDKTINDLSNNIIETITKKEEQETLEIELTKIKVISFNIEMVDEE